MEKVTLNTLQREHLKARLDKNNVRKAVLEVLIANVQNEEIKMRSSLTESEMIDVIKRERKQIIDSLDFAKKAERQDLIEQEQSKLAVVEEFLPKLLSEQEILDLLEEKGFDTSNVAKKDFGKMMQAVMATHKSVVDGKVLSATISRLVN